MHPYTQMLLASVPQLHRKWDGRDVVAPVPDGDDGDLVEAEEEHYVAR